MALKTEMVQLRRAQQDSEEEVSNLRMALAQEEGERRELQLTLEAAQVGLCVSYGMVASVDRSLSYTDDWPYYVPNTTTGATGHAGGRSPHATGRGGGGGGGGAGV